MRKRIPWSLYIAIGVVLLLATPVERQLFKGSSAGKPVNGASGSLPFFTGTATLKWDGIVWDLKNGIAGPGGNNWSSSSQNVWVDKQNFLHLKITKNGNVWTCAEIDSHDPMGYGAYNFQVNSYIDRMDPAVVFGMFNYQDLGADHTPQENEIDIEYSFWKNRSLPNNADFAIQYRRGGNADNLSLAPAKLFRANLTGNYTTHLFTWLPGQVKIMSINGHHNSDPGQKYHIADTTYSGPMVPRANREKVCLNLWLNNRQNQSRAPGPFNQKEVEVVIRSFTFTPAAPVRKARQ